MPSVSLAGSKHILLTQKGLIQANNQVLKRSIQILLWNLENQRKIGEKIKQMFSLIVLSVDNILPIRNKGSNFDSDNDCY